MNSYNFKWVLILVAIMVQFETSFAETPIELSKVEIKEKLKKLTPEARLEAISRAEVVEKKIDKLHREAPEKIGEINVVQELKHICGENYNYVNDESKPNVTWPTVSCKYHRATKTLGGSTNKFLCDFNETKKNGEKVVKTRKVKYLAFTGIKNSELVPSLLASSIARLVGLPTESYCPAIISCENCPTNMPYEFGKGEGRPSRETFDFKDAMVEIPADYMTITPNTAETNTRARVGVDWNEVFKIQETTNKTVREKAIEREAWLLWLNLIVEMDAHRGNQKISCGKASTDGSQVYCESPVMYTHDYGQSFFRRFQFNKWKNHIPLIQNADETCSGGMTKNILKDEKGGNPDGPELAPIVSAEARDFLVSRLRNITDRQWIDIVRIVNTERLFRVSPEDFLKAMKTKIEMMSQVRCAPFDSRTSAFGVRRT